MVIRVKESKRASVSIEAILGVTLLVAIVLLFVSMLRVIEVNESMNQVLHESVMDYSQLSYMEAKFDLSQLNIFKENDEFLKIMKELKLDAYISCGLKERFIQERVALIVNNNHKFRKLIKNLRVKIDQRSNSNFARISLSYNIHFPFFVEDEINIVKSINKRLWNGGNDPVYMRKLTPKADDVRDYYITNTGSKYHYEGCIYLKKSRVPIQLEEALRRGYTSCKICIINGGSGYGN